MEALPREMDLGFSLTVTGGTEALPRERDLGFSFPAAAGCFSTEALPRERDLGFSFPAAAGMCRHATAAAAVADLRVGSGRRGLWGLEAMILAPAPPRSFNLDDMIF